MTFNLFKKNTKKSKPAKTVAKEAVEQADVAPTAHIAVGSTVIKHFYVSEKSTRGQAYNQFAFVVANKATKTDVKHAVQRAFKVHVTDVHLIRLPAKKRRIGRYEGSTPGIKKAIVVIKEGETIAQAQP